MFPAGATSSRGSSFGIEMTAKEYSGTVEVSNERTETIMRCVIQRVRRAAVEVGGQTAGAVGPGMVVLLGVREDDEERDAEWLAAKTVKLRIFDDEDGVMNRSILETDGDILVVSQFTLHANVRKGNRPSYNLAAGPDRAVPLYEHYAAKVEEALGKPIQRGVFGAEMLVSLVNDGPVTIIMDSRE